MKRSLVIFNLDTGDAKLKQKVAALAKNGQFKLRINTPGRLPQNREWGWEITITAEIRMENLKASGVTRPTRTKDGNIVRPRPAPVIHAKGCGFHLLFSSYFLS